MRSATAYLMPPLHAGCGPLQVAVIADEAALYTLKHGWNDALSESSADCVFLTWEWVTTWWQHFGRNRQLNVLVVRTPTQIVGIAPFCVSGRSLEFLGTGSVGSDYLDLIMRSGFEADVMEAIAKYLEHSGLVIRLRQFLPSSGAQRLAERLATNSHLVLQRPGMVCPFLPLGHDSWEAFVASLGSSHRYNLRKKLRIFQSCGQLGMTTTESERQQNLDILISLHNKRWAARGGSDAFHNAALVAFHRDFSALALERGWLRLFVLRVDNTAAAAVYGFSRRGKACFYQGGFSSDYERLSVGLVGLGLSIRHALEEGAHEYDLLHGNESYKSLWASRVRELRACDLYPRSVAGTLNMHLDRSIRHTRRLARYVISRIRPMGKRPVK